jgi:hypothetical protein
MVVFKLYATEDCRKPCRETYYDATSRCRNTEEFQIKKDRIQSGNQTSQQMVGHEEIIKKKCMEGMK